MPAGGIDSSTEGCFRNGLTKLHPEVQNALHFDVG